MTLLQSLLADYVHSHDDGEANTFYEQSTRSLLKMCIGTNVAVGVASETYTNQKKRFRIEKKGFRTT